MNMYDILWPWIHLEVSFDRQAQNNVLRLKVSMHHFLPVRWRLHVVLETATFHEQSALNQRLEQEPEKFFGNPSIRMAMIVGQCEEVSMRREPAAESGLSMCLTCRVCSTHSRYR